MKPVWKTCSRGHRFQKSSDCPACPICWSGNDRRRAQSDFPEKMSAPALRAFANAKIQNLSDLTKWTEKEILGLHGVGPSTIRILAPVLRKKGLALRQDRKK